MACLSKVMKGTKELTKLVCYSNMKQLRLQFEGKRFSSHGPRVMQVKSSEFGWLKMKDLCYFYAFIGLAPLILISLYANIFIGPAVLTEIPEGYEPQHWEYIRHPISRFFAKYITPNPQQVYEKNMHFWYEHGEKILIRNLEKKVKELMANREDYQAWYFLPEMAKYYRYSRRGVDTFEEYGSGMNAED